MNLRVDLILPHEQRSGNPVSAKTLGRVGTIVGPLILVLIIGKFVWSAHQENSDFAALQQDLEQTKPLHAQAVEMLESFNTNREAKEELAGWSKTRTAWNTQLLGLMQLVPTNVQIQSFRTKERLVLINNQNTPARELTVSMKGRAIYGHAEESVKAFVDSLETASPFGAGIISNVDMNGRADKAPGAAATDRTFDISCTYFTRTFK